MDLQQLQPQLIERALRYQAETVPPPLPVPLEVELSLPSDEEGEAVMETAVQLRSRLLNLCLAMTPTTYLQVCRGGGENGQGESCGGVCQKGMTPDTCGETEAPCLCLSVDYLRGLRYNFFNLKLLFFRNSCNLLG